MYSGEKVENPVAERTRNIQEWGVLDSWQKTIKGPMTFTQLAKQWAPTSRGYARDIDLVAQRFFSGPCNDDDPQPELVAEARGQAGAKSTQAAAAATSKAVPTRRRSSAKPDANDKVQAQAQQSAAETETKSKGADAARRSVDEAKAMVQVSASPSVARQWQVLASTPPAKPAAAAAAEPETKSASASPPVTLLNGEPAVQRRMRPSKWHRSRAWQKTPESPRNRHESRQLQVPRLDCELWGQQGHHHQGAGRKDRELHRARCERGNREARS